MANFEDSDAYITQVRGQRAIIDVGSAKPKVGDIFIAYDNNGKRKGILKIIKVSRSQALAQILKGSAQLDWSVSKYQKKPQRPKAKAKPKPRQQEELDFADEEESEETAEEGGEDQMEESGESEDSEDQESPDRKPSKLKAGIMAGYNMNSMTVQIENLDDELTSVSMSGNSIGFYAFAIYEIMPKLDIFASLGQEKFETSGEIADDTCNTDEDPLCSSTTPYLAASLLARYRFFDSGNFSLSVGGGFGFLKPGSVESEVLDAASVKATLVYSGAIGLDWKFKRNLTVPAMVRYTLFPAAENVKASYLSIMAGVAYHF